MVKKPAGGGDTSFEDEERIGEKRTKKDSFEDLPEEGEEKRTSKDGFGRQIEEAVDLYKAAKPLASYKVPRAFVFLPELPRNATGKVLKRQLVDESAA